MALIVYTITQISRYSNKIVIMRKPYIVLLSTYIHFIISIQYFIRATYLSINPEYDFTHLVNLSCTLIYFLANAKEESVAF